MKAGDLRAAIAALRLELRGEERGVHLERCKGVV
jgi:hypothetical protein